MQVLVTGATGLIGSHLVDLLLERGDSVRALVRPGEATNRLKQARVHVCWGDLSDRASLEAAVRGMDRVLHCAARTGVWGPRSEYEMANIRGLETLLNVAMAAGIRRFVHVSTNSVHGVNQRGVVDETAPLRTLPNPYSWSKIAGERLLDRAIRERRAPVTVVRPGWSYGPRDTTSFARFAAMIQQNRMVVIGSGDNHLPLIYVRDVAEGIVLASQAAQAVGRTYLLVNDEPVTQREFLGAIATELGVPVPNRNVPYSVALMLGAIAEGLCHLTRRRPPLTRYGVQVLGGESRFAIKRARDELGFNPQTNMAEGVRRSVAWFREDYCASRGEGRP
jgi:nucleoside-diphosphate-sugar epimerase